ncbi:MAG: copper chaperone PCu(A)C [Acidimicrobiales bacterium]
MNPRTLPSFRRSAAATGLAITALLPVAAGCGSDDATTATETTETAVAATGDTSTADPTTDDTTTDDTAGSENDGETITVTDAWARSTAPTATNGALYFVITSTTDDVLTAVTIDPSVAETVEIHETVPADESMTDDDTTDDPMTDDAMTDHSMSDDAMADGAMTMQELPDGLELPAGEPVVLEPGGYHVMLMGLAEPLVAGGELEVTLEFAEAPPQTMLVAIMDTAP